MNSLQLYDATASGTRSARNPVKSIRAKCIDCVGTEKEPGFRSKVRDCEFTDCALYLFRFGKDPYRGKPKPDGYLPPLKAIRAECLSCCCDSAYEVRLCPSVNCPVHAYRFGINPVTSAKCAELARQNPSLSAFKRSTAEEVAPNSVEEGSRQGVGS